MPDEKVIRRQAAKKVAEEAMPGWTVVPDEEEALLADAADAAQAPTPDATLPSLDQMRQKYFGAMPAAADHIPEDALQDDDTEVFTVKSGPIQKKIGVKGEKISWTQG